MAIAILGWPLDKLPKETAQVVVDGARSVCQEAGIPLAGGHSIDIGDPVFGLAVTGSVALDQLKRNDQAQPGCRLYLTKPLGVGAISTAQKQGKVAPGDHELAVRSMTTLNKPGVAFAKIAGVKAMTDVTGFGLMGHLVEMCEGSGVNAEIEHSQVPVIPGTAEYVAQGCVPGGTHRNRASYGHKISGLDESNFAILCDPQTSGGLLVAVTPEDESHFVQQAQALGLELNSFGTMVERSGDDPTYVRVL